MQDIFLREHWHTDVLSGVLLPFAGVVAASLKRKNDSDEAAGEVGREKSLFFYYLCLIRYFLRN